MTETQIPQPTLKTVVTFDGIDLIKWAAPLLNIEDYHTIWGVVLPEAGNDSYQAFFLKTELDQWDDPTDPDNEIIISFSKLLIDTYDELEENSELALWVCW